MSTRLSIAYGVSRRCGWSVAVTRFGRVAWRGTGQELHGPIKRCGGGGVPDGPLNARASSSCCGAADGRPSP